jgi:hypothetical protein
MVLPQSGVFVKPDSVLARTAREMLDAHAGGSGPRDGMTICPQCGEPLPCGAGQAAAEVVTAAGLAETSGLVAAARQGRGPDLGQPGYGRLDPPLLGSDRPAPPSRVDVAMPVAGLDAPGRAPTGPRASDPSLVGPGPVVGPGLGGPGLGGPGLGGPGLGGPGLGGPGLGGPGLGGHAPGGPGANGLRLTKGERDGFGPTQPETDGPPPVAGILPVGAEAPPSGLTWPTPHRVDASPATPLPSLEPPVPQLRAQEPPALGRTGRAPLEPPALGRTDRPGTSPVGRHNGTRPEQPSARPPLEPPQLAPKAGRAPLQPPQFVPQNRPMGQSQPSQPPLGQPAPGQPAPGQPAPGQPQSGQPAPGLAGVDGSPPASATGGLPSGLPPLAGAPDETQRFHRPESGDPSAA